MMIRQLSLSNRCPKMYESVLIPTDGGRKSKKAAAHGIELASAVGATVHSLYVMDLPGAPRTPYIYRDEENVKQEYREYGEEVTGEIREMAEESGVECTTAVEPGAVHERIVDYADEEGIHLIVIVAGYRGRFGGLMSTTTEKVIRSASVPVTSLRMGEVRRS
jgi:nucleotide-binding universal stress UspA family protein